MDDISFNPQELAADFTVRPFTSESIPFGETRSVLEGNSNRIALVFFTSATAGDYFVGPFSSVTTDNGWEVIVGAIGPAEFIYRDWGAMVGFEWFIFNSGMGPNTYSGLEVIYIPEK